MKTWIALIRGINVGGRHKLPMKKLVAIMESHGFADVQTYIQSGNVIFRSAKKPDGTLGRLIESEFGFQPGIFFHSAAELRMAVENCPYQPREGKHLHFFFCDRVPVSLDTALLDTLKSPTEEYRLAGKVFYLHAPDGIGRSKLAEKMGKAFRGVDMTARNMNTVSKLIELSGK